MRETRQAISQSLLITITDRARVLTVLSQVPRKRREPTRTNEKKFEKRVDLSIRVDTLQEAKERVANC